MGKNRLSPPGVLLALLMAFSLAGIWCVGYEANHLREYRMTPAERAVEMQRKGEFLAASLLWEQAASTGIDKVTALGEKAYCEYRAGKIDLALKTCDQISAIDASSGKSHYLRGMIHQDRGNTDAARDEFRLALFNGDKTTREVAALQLQRLGE